MRELRNQPRLANASLTTDKHHVRDAATCPIPSALELVERGHASSESCVVTRERGRQQANRPGSGRNGREGWVIRAKTWDRQLEHSFRPGESPQAILAEIFECYSRVGD